MYSKQRWKEAQDSLQDIAKVNKADKLDYRFYAEVDSSSAIHNSSPSMVEAFKDKIYRNNLCIMALNWAVCSLSFYIIGYYVGSFPGSLFLNAIVMSIADLIASVFSSTYIKNVGFNKGFVSAYILVIIITSVYNFTQAIQIVAYICVFVMRLGIGMCFSM